MRDVRCLYLRRIYPDEKEGHLDKRILGEMSINWSYMGIPTSYKCKPIGRNCKPTDYRDILLSQKDILLSRKDILLTQKDIILTQKDIILTQKDILLSLKDIILTQKGIILTQRDILLSQRDIPMSHSHKDISRILKNISHILKDISHILKDISHILKDISRKHKDISRILKDITYILKDISRNLKDITRNLKVITRNLKVITHIHKDISHILKEISRSNWYDALGRNTETEAAYGTTLATTTYSVYDKAGRMLTQYVGSTTYANHWDITCSQGIISCFVTDYAYNKANQLTQKSYEPVPGLPGPVPLPVTYIYDAEGNVLKAGDGVNSDTINRYDDLGRVVKVSDLKLNKHIVYGYRADGLRETMTVNLGPSVESVAYAYDGAKRLLGLVRNGTPEATYWYNPLGQRVQLDLGNGAYTVYQYEHPQRWLTAVLNYSITTTLISGFSYTHDLVANRKTMQLADGQTVSYDYDEIYQLKREKRLDNLGNVVYDITWDYDEVGNRKTQTKNQGTIITTLYSYNDANQLISETTNLQTTNYVYDANGNMTTKTSPQGTCTYGYDAENRQIGYMDMQNPANNTTYTYDALGRRVAKITPLGTESYLYDGANVVADYDGNNNLTASYVTPFLDQNLLVNRQTGGNWQTYYYMQDGLGSVRNLLDSAQSVVNSYDYYAFGEALNWSETVPNRYTYTSREWDNESSTYHYRPRQYNPYTGRFNRRDDIEYEGGINLYSYVGNNAVNAIDPFGEYGKIKEFRNCGDPNLWEKGQTTRADVGKWIQKSCDDIRDAYNAVSEYESGAIKKHLTTAPLNVYLDNKEQRKKVKDILEKATIKCNKDEFVIVCDEFAPEVGIHAYIPTVLGLADELRLWLGTPLENVLKNEIHICKPFYEAPKITEGTKQDRLASEIAHYGGATDEDPYPVNAEEIATTLVPYLSNAAQKRLQEMEEERKRIKEREAQRKAK